MAPVDGPDFDGPSRARASADAADGTHKFVTFFIGERQYAVHSSAVSEVTAKLNATALPDAPDRLIGIAPLRGEIVAVVDLASEPAPRSYAADKQKTVVLKHFDTEGEIPVAINVDRLCEFISIELASIKELADTSDPLAGLEALTENGPIRIIEPARLAASLYQ